MLSKSTYLVITPVKDEEKHVEYTLQSMVRQSLKPVRWVIVDDGSNDRTAEIIERYAKNHSFIGLVRIPRGQDRQPGSAIVRAFNRGYEIAQNIDYDFIVKLDCDLSFEVDYFAELLAKMQSDPRLGIASGVYMEAPDEVTWREVEMPPYHAAGACKVIRRICFQEIGGFIPARGWDTVDEIRAMTRGWRTRHFRELKMKHLKPEGMGIGSLRTNFMHGEIYSLTGGSYWFFLFKVIHRFTQRPFLVGGAALFWGYLRTQVSQKASLVTADEARFYRRLLNERVSRGMKRFFHVASTIKAS